MPPVCAERHAMSRPPSDPDGSDGSGARPTELGRIAVSGAKWTVGARLIRVLFTLGTIMVLSRLLEPAVFGTIALILFVIGLAQLLGDFGARLALVQRPEIDEIDRSSVFWFNGFLYLVLFAGGMIFAPQIAALFDAPEMTDPLRWITPVFLIQALQGVPLSLLERSYAFSAIALAETVGSIVGSVAAIAVAMSGGGVETLVTQVLVAAVVTTAMIVHRARWRPRLLLNIARLKPLVVYGGYITLAGFIQFVANNADRPIINGGLSAEALGFFSVAQQIITTPTKVIVNMVRKVMFPLMSSIQTDDARVRTAYLRTIHALMLVMAPICLGLFAIADTFTAVVLGDGWGMVGTLLTFMALRALLITIGDFNASLFQAKGRARFQFRWSVVSSVLTIGALLACLPYGLVAVIAGRLAVSIVLTPINSMIAFRMIDLPVGAFMRAIAAPLVAAGAMAAAVAAVQAMLSLSPLPMLAVLVPFGGLCYAATLLVIDRPRTLDIVRLALRRGSRTGQGPSA